MEPRKIILMEDDPDIAWLTQMQLQRAGFEVSTASDGRAGLDAFEDGGADLLLIDIDLPILNGWEVCAGVRSVSQVPIIMLTAYPQGGKGADPRSRDGEVVIEKPFTFTRLLDGIEAALTNGRPLEPVA